MTFAIDDHPEPPAKLDSWELPIAEMTGPWWRCHRVARDPIFFNRGPLGRFNAPDGEYGVLYLAIDPAGAFVETFGQSLHRDDLGWNVVSEPDLRQRCLCRIDREPPREGVRLVDLTGPGLARIGADSRLNTTTGDRGLPKRWSAAFWRHPSRPDGILYRVRHDPEQIGIALFDHVGGSWIVDHSGNVLADPALLATILHRYRFALNPTLP